MASRSPLLSKRGRREDDDDESRRRKKLEKGKEPAAKDADEKPLFDDNKFAAELLRSAFRKLEGVGEAFDIKAHHDAYKDPTLKGLAFRILGLAEKLENLPVVKQAARRHFFFDDGDDGSQGGDGGTPTNLYTPLPISNNNVCVLLCLRPVLGHEQLSLSVDYELLS
jgi:hypothetical protein